MSSSSTSFLLGTLAALLAPFIMVVGFIVWDEHWHGSAFALNLFKCTLVTVWFAAYIILSSLFLSSEDNQYEIFSSSIYTPTTLGWLSLSSTIGIVLGDWTWLEGMRLLGARKVIVMDSMKPFLAALVGWFVLKERLHLSAFVGLPLTVVGVALVGLEQEQEKDQDGDTNSNDQEKGCADNNDAEGKEGQVVVKLVLHGNSDKRDVKEETNNDNEDTLQEDEEGSASILTTANTASAPMENFSSPPFPLPVQLPAQKSATKQRSASSSSYSEQRRQRIQTSKEMQYGLVMAIANVVLHTWGALITKKYGTAMTTWDICLIRFGFAALCMIVVSVGLQLRDYLVVVVGLGDNKPQPRMASTLHDPTTDNNKMDDNEAVFSDGAETDESDNEPVTRLVVPWYKLPPFRVPKNVIVQTATQQAEQQQQQQQQQPSPQKSFLSKLSRRWLHVLGGVLLVSFLNPALTNYAVFQIPFALLLTLESIGPLYALPLSFVLQQERPTHRACLGAVLAVAGIAILSLLGDYDQE
jgi:drug/metabolite transporter (DMT)-like permease